MSIAKQWDDRIGRRLKLRDLHILMTVAQCGGMGKAAVQLAVSQSAVSKAIADMEYMLGVRLLDRTSQGVEPTLYGRTLLKWGVAVFDDLRQGVKELEFLADLTAGEVRVGSTEAMTAGLVPAVIDRLSRQFPRLVFNVMQARTLALQYRDLRERSVDLILGRMVMPIADEDLNVETLFDDPLFVVAGVDSNGHGAAKSTLPNWSMNRGAFRPTMPLLDRVLLKPSVRTVWNLPGIPSHQIPFSYSTHCLLPDVF